MMRIEAILTPLVRNGTLGNAEYVAIVGAVQTINEGRTEEEFIENYGTFAREGITMLVEEPTNVL